MNAAYKDFIIEPIGNRYNNSVRVDEKELILNTEVFNHQYVNRKAKVIATPLLFQSPVNIGKIESQKHQLLHNLDEAQKGIKTMQDMLVKEYGTYDVSLEDGTINWPKDEK